MSIFRYLLDACWISCGYLLEVCWIPFGQHRLETLTKLVVFDLSSINVHGVRVRPLLGIVVHACFEFDAPEPHTPKKNNKWNLKETVENIERA